MEAQLNQEAKDDAALYEKITCWCTSNDGEKTNAIKNAEVKIEQLDAKIEKLSGKISRLSSEIDDLNEEIADNTDVLEKATALRKKEYESFSAYEAETLTAIGSLKNAVQMLSKHNSMLDETSFLAVSKNISLPLKNMDSRLIEILSPQQRIALESFMQQPVAAASKSYNNRSGEIFGILTNMLETFQSDLAAAQQEESTKQANFEKFKKGKEDEIEAATNQVDTKTTPQTQKK
jgi:chromosome segregation ATPase